MKLKIIEKVLTIFGILNLIIFLLFLTFGNHGGWFVVELPYLIGELLLFYSPIIFTMLSLILFVFDYYKNDHKNWYCFFMTTISYLPVVIFVVCSVHRPAH